MVVGGVVLALGGLAVWVVARLGRAGRLGRNTVAGIRLPSTMRSDEAWHAAHVAGYGPTAAGGIVAVAAGLLAALVAIGDDESSIAAGLVLGGGLVLLALVVIGGVVGVRAARRVSDVSAG